MLHTFTKFLFLFLSVFSIAKAQVSYIWTGSVNSAWNNSGNWNPSAIPTSSDYVTIPGTGVASWPIMSADVTLAKFILSSGSQIDTRGLNITTGNLQMSGATINNSQSGTLIRFSKVAQEILTYTINNSTFNGNTQFNTGSGQNFVGEGNHFIGNTKFLMTASGGMSIFNDNPSVFDGNVEVECLNGTTMVPFFQRGATVNGDFSYINLVGGTMQSGPFAVNVSGKINIDLLSTTVNIIGLKNATDGGSVSIKNSTYISLNNINLKLSSFSIDSPTAYIDIRGCAIESDNITISGNNVNTLGSTFDGTEKITIWGTTSLEDSKHLGNVTLVCKNLTYTPNIREQYFRDLTLDILNANYSGPTATFSGSQNSVLKCNQVRIGQMVIFKTNGSRMILDGPCRISYYATFTSGIVQSNTASPLVFLKDAGAYGNVGDNSHVVGPVNKIGNQYFTFPIGSGTKLAAVEISQPSNATDEFSAEYIQSDPSLNGYDVNTKAGSISKVYEKSYWDVKRISGSSNVSVSLGYNVPSGYITNQSKLRVAHWNGSIWEDLGNGGTGGSLTVGTVATAGVVTNFSPFTIASADASNPLPVKLVSFSAQKENETALLQWSTSAEMNSDIFEIENSPNAQDWQKIGEVKSAGERTKLSRYQFVDIKPMAGINYYRLKMIDLDGTFAYSRIESIKMSPATQTILYPNPVSEKLFIRTSSTTSAIKIKLTNLNGVDLLVANKSDLDHGINLSALPGGIYLVKITMSDNQIETHKVFVKK